MYLLAGSGLAVHSGQNIRARLASGRLDSSVVKTLTQMAAAASGRPVLLLHCIATVLLLGFASSAIATNARFHNYFLSDGVPGKTVWASHEDAFGYLWIGGTGGLARFDGSRFASFPFPETDGQFPQGVIVRDFTIAPDNTIWVGTLQSGAFRVIPYSSLDKTSSIEHVASEGKRIRSIATTSNRVFAGTSEGLEIWDASIQQFTLTSETDLHTSVSEIYVVSDETLLVGTSKGVYQYDIPAASATAIAADLLGSHTVFAIERAGDGSYFAGTLNGVAQFSTQGTSRGFLDWVDRSIAVFSIVSIGGDHWLGTRTAGLIHVEKGDIVNHFGHDPRNPRSISDSTVTSVEVDRSGTVWAGSFSQGIDRLDPATLRFGWHDASTSGFECLKDSNVYVFFETNEALWVGTTNGLARIEGANDECKSVETGNVDVVDILQTEFGEIWAATSHGPSRVLQSNGRYVLQPPLMDGFAKFVSNSGPDSLIVGGEIGLIRIDTLAGSAELVSLTSGGHQPIVYAEVPGNNGDHLLGTSTGLLRWHPGFGASELKLMGVEKDRPVKVLLSSRSSLWLGIPEAGFIQMEPDTGRAKVRLRPGEVGEILAIIDDGSHFWLTTTAGVIRYDPDTENVQRYAPSDGLQSEVFTFGAVMKDSHGRIHLGGRRGWNVFDPKDIQPNLVPRRSR